MTKVTLFKTPTCTKCQVVRSVLTKILREGGLRYEDYVIEKDVTEDSEAMAELLMLNTLSTPVVKYEDLVLRDNDAIEEGKLKMLLKAAGVPLS